MRAYFDLTQSQVRMAPNGQGRHLWIYDRQRPTSQRRDLASARELFRQAEAAADNDAVRARVRKARIGIDYTALIRSKKFTVEGDSYCPDRPRRAEGPLEHVHVQPAPVRHHQYHRRDARNAR